MRILREAVGMRRRGHTLLFAVAKGAELGRRAAEAGFEVRFLPFAKSRIRTAVALMRWIRKARIDIVNTHSSIDAWTGGVAAKLCGCAVVRTRHVSASVRGGLNAWLLYRVLADAVVTTCRATALALQRKAHLPAARCRSIPTGVEPIELRSDPQKRAAFRKSLGVTEGDLLVGTLCVLRKWKGIHDLLHAAKELEQEPRLKWVIVGAGPSEREMRQEWTRLGLAKRVAFTGFIDPPFDALAAMDLFCLLSTENEGVSQASLQAAYLQKPLITTPVGGLPEVCLDGKTGFIVPPGSPQEVARRVLELSRDGKLRQSMGEEARKLVMTKFTFTATLQGMEEVYRLVLTP